MGTPAGPAGSTPGRRPQPPRSTGHAPAAIAFCPQPPLLVPSLAAGAAAELDGVRAACREALRRLAAARPDRVVVLGGGPETAAYPPGSSGTLAGFGLSVVASLGVPAAPPWTLPPALTLGAWLLADAGLSAPAASAQAMRPDADPAGVAVLVSAAAGSGGSHGSARVGLLVMGDGSARRSEQAPGHVDARAEPFDAAVAAALAAGDAAALRALDPALGADLLAAGVPAWRVAGHAAAGLDLAAELLHHSAPYGVGYLVASWIPR